MRDTRAESTLQTFPDRRSHRTGLGDIPACPFRGRPLLPALANPRQQRHCTGSRPGFIEQPSPRRYESCPCKRNAGLAFLWPLLCDLKMLCSHSAEVAASSASEQGGRGVPPGRGLCVMGGCKPEAAWWSWRRSRDYLVPSLPSGCSALCRAGRALLWVPLLGAEPRPVGAVEPPLMVRGVTALWGHKGEVSCSLELWPHSLLQHCF